MNIAVVASEFSSDSSFSSFSPSSSSSPTTTKFVEEEEKTVSVVTKPSPSSRTAEVPHSSESEEAVNVQNQEAHAFTAEATNKVKVSFEDLVTVYALANLNENVYLKAGIMQVELITEESLGTGGAYGNDTLEGYTFGLGYNHNYGDGMFVRAEAAYIDIDGTTLTNTNDSTKSVSADGISGYGAAVSVGKSF